jgi:hypothetical protein
MIGRLQKFTAPSSPAAVAMLKGKKSNTFYFNHSDEKLTSFYIWNCVKICFAMYFYPLGMRRCKNALKGQGLINSQ